MPQWPALLAVIGMLWWAGCAPARWSAPTPKPAASSGIPVTASQPTHEFLLDGYDENLSAPMYGYVLIGPPAHSEKARQWQEVLAKAVWERLARQNPDLEPGPRGISVWPIRGLDQPALQAATVDQEWAVWVDHYHHQRAQVIYDRVGLFAEAGAHLITSLEPLGSLADDWQPRFLRVLVLDLSNLPAEDLDRVLERYRQHVLENPVPAPSAWKLSALDAAFQDLWEAGSQSRFSVRVIP